MEKWLICGLNWVSRRFHCEKPAWVLEEEEKKEELHYGLPVEGVYRTEELLSSKDKLS